MSAPRKSRSIRAARDYSRALAWDALVPGTAALLGAWAAPMYEPTPWIPLIVGLAAGWAVLCNQARGLVRGRVLSLDLPALAFLALAILGPTPKPLLIGALLGLAAYVLVLSGAVHNPRLETIAGDRYCRFRHPLDRLAPLTYLAPAPLSPLFDPVVALHWSPGPLALPEWRISVFDPPSLHTYISSQASQLASRRPTWINAITRFRSALGLLGLLETLRKSELAGLEGAALTAAARLALAAFPELARESLRDALAALAPSRRRALLEAFDLRGTDSAALAG